MGGEKGSWEMKRREGEHDGSECLAALAVSEAGTLGGWRAAMAL